MVLKAGAQHIFYCILFYRLWIRNGTAQRVVLHLTLLNQLAVRS